MENSHDWDAIAHRAKEAANWACQHCGIRHKEHDADGVEAIIGVAHLDQDSTNHAPENLKVLCQRCHFEYDQPFNIMRRKYGKNFHLPPQQKLW